MILKRGDHEFIKKPSFINYGRSRVVTLTQINKLIADGKAKQKPKVSNSVLVRVRGGVRRSKRTPNEILIAYSNHMDRELD
ncbi:MAG: hypothetical protein JXA13_17255 [Anaerolineales bacterium]|nr:hypothetical protein [Anaerolineales bacterium]